MLHLVSGIVGQLIFVLIYFRWKRLRKRGAGTRSTFAVFGYAVPMLAAIAFFQYDDRSVNISPHYVAAVAAWIIPCLIMNYGEIFLFRFQGLTEYTGMRTSIVAVLALVADWAIFGLSPQISIIAGAAITIAGGLMLRSNRESNVDDGHRIPIRRAALALVIVAGSTVAAMSAYKYSLSLQSNFVFHAGFAQALLFSLCFVIGFKQLAQDVEDGVITGGDVLYLVFTITVFVFFESYAYISLPLILFVALDMIHPLCFVAADFHSRELSVTIKALAGSVLVIAGIALLAFFRM